MDCKESQPVNPKWNQSWIFIGRTNAEADTPILSPPDVKNELTGKDPDAGNVWNLEEKGTTENEIQPVHLKGNQSWVFIGGTDAEAETPILWPPDVKNWLIWKDPDGERLRAGGEGTTEDKMVGWHHRFNEHEFGWTLGVGDGQGGLVHGITTSQTRLSDWTEVKCKFLKILKFMCRKWNIDRINENEAIFKKQIYTFEINWPFQLNFGGKIFLYRFLGDLLFFQKSRSIVEN